MKLDPRYPLGLPPGSVRALLAISLVMLLATAIHRNVGDSALAILAGLASSAVTFYFTRREQEDDDWDDPPGL